ncbi:MAG: ATP-grasp domain-containing protein, partial [Gammaproteobacteria bacterium]|nr:ATP-grasp domain-containing protein [Gammaproteobacteria bacterium]
AKDLMINNQVDCIPGYQGEDQSDARFAEKATELGFPLMVKAAAGGGGRGIRLVTAEGDLAAALSSARIESTNAFGSDELILEKAVVGGRHIEIQVVADGQGNVVHLFERDCSVQRRHQKVIEEAPSTFMTQELRSAMGSAAVEAARAVNYEGVGTVEFLVDSQQQFYFLEMNTRLQVEHPVTEMIADVDLVDWQLRIANGESLPVSQEQLSIQGHAIEVRIYAEDPSKGFMPQTGKLATFIPADEEGVRIDFGVCSGSTISPYYDAMLAKLIAWGRDREEARRRLIRGLKNTRILGLTTNKAFLLHLLNEPLFVSGEFTTGFIDDALLARASVDLNPEDVALAAVVLAQSRHPLNGWSNAEPMLRTELLRSGDQVMSVGIVQMGEAYRVTINEEQFDIDRAVCDDGELVYQLNGLDLALSYHLQGDDLSLDVGERTVSIERLTYQPAVSEDAAGSGVITASTEGLVIDVLVSPGDKVKRGDILVYVEAMKMEHRHLADGDGEVSAVRVEKGQQVKNRQLLVELALEETAN